MEGVVRKFQRHFEDMRDLGPTAIQRIFHKPAANGYSVIKTRYGRFFLRRYDTDLSVLKQVFVSREYDLDRYQNGKTVRSAYCDALHRDKMPLIIDAGANAGYTCRFFAQAYPEATILAIEPDRDNAGICRANTAHLPRVQVVEAAVGSEPGYASIERFDGNSWATRVHRSATGVPVVTIKELQSGARNSELLIVKLDIEGSELDLFARTTEWIGETCAIIVEPHDWMLPGAGSSRTLQQAMLREDRELLILGDNLIWIKQPPRDPWKATGNQ